MLASAADRAQVLTMAHRWRRVSGIVLDSYPPWNPVECANCGLGGYEHGGKVNDAGIPCYGARENEGVFVNYAGKVSP